MKENRRMRLLTALGIILTVAGHCDANYLSIKDLFPYYSFHVYIFLFVAGYFYKSEDEKDLKAYVCRKAKSLLLPYFIWNLIYGAVSTVLVHNGIFIGGTLTLKNIFLEPILGGHQFMLNFPAWFVVALFVVEMMNIIMRLILKSCFSLWKAKNIETSVDITAFILSFIIGVVTVYLAIGGHVWDHLRTPGRWLIMLFGIELGIMYRKYLEKLLESVKSDKVKSGFDVLGIVLLVLIQCVIVRHSNGINFSTVWCSSFANGPFMPFMTVTTGIMFWLSVIRLLDRFIPDDSTALSPFLTVGRESYSIMTNHIAVLFLINSIWYLISSAGLLPALPEFDIREYTYNVQYQYLYAGYHLTRIINTLLMVTIPTVLGFIYKKFTAQVKNAKAK